MIISGKIFIVDNLVMQMSKRYLTEIILFKQARRVMYLHNDYVEHESNTTN